MPAAFADVFLTLLLAQIYRECGVVGIERCSQVAVVAVLDSIEGCVHYKDY